MFGQKQSQIFVSQLVEWRDFKLAPIRSDSFVELPRLLQFLSKILVCAFVERVHLKLFSEGTNRILMLTERDIGTSKIIPGVLLIRIGVERTFQQIRGGAEVLPLHRRSAALAQFLRRARHIRRFSHRSS